jgi:hypothetical protein
MARQALGREPGTSPSPRAHARTEIVAPNLDRLAEYVAALQAGWSPNTTRDVTARNWRRSGPTRLRISRRCGATFRA